MTKATFKATTFASLTFRARTWQGGGALPAAGGRVTRTAPGLPTPPPSAPGSVTAAVTAPGAV